MDIREILRHLRQGHSDRAIARATGANRKTMGRYRTWAKQHGLLTGPLPPQGDLQRLLDETLRTVPPPQNESSVEPFREMVCRLRGQGVRWPHSTSD